MKITVITAEYNPLHNGHAYHIAKTRERFPNDYLVGIMSGSFTQRAEPAVLDKFTRARHAILSGLDAVIELPAFASFLSGEQFAKTSMDVAKLLGANAISFGTECGDISKLQEINRIIENPSDGFHELFQKNMDDGKSYPRALCETFRAFYPNEDYADILAHPNNNLALFYMRAIKDTDITPFSVLRSDNGFHSDAPLNNFLSASGIRERLLKGDFENLKYFVPDYVLLDLKNAKYDNLKEFSTIVLFKFKTMKKQEIARIFDVSEGLENRFKKYVNEVNTLDELLEKVKTKRYTLSRLRRIALCALFDITKEHVKEFEKGQTYGRLLAVKKDKTDLLSHLKKCGIITRFSDLQDRDDSLWKIENTYADTHALLLRQKITNKNTLYI